MCVGVCGDAKERISLTHNTHIKTPREGTGGDREQTSASRAKVETGILVVAHFLPVVDTYFNLSGT